MVFNRRAFLSLLGLAPAVGAIGPGRSQEPEFTAVIGDETNAKPRVIKWTAQSPPTEWHWPKYDKAVRPIDMTDIGENG